MVLDHASDVHIQRSYPVQKYQIKSSHWLAYGLCFV